MYVIALHLGRSFLFSFLERRGFVITAILQELGIDLVQSIELIRPLSGLCYFFASMLSHSCSCSVLFRSCNPEYKECHKKKEKKREKKLLTHSRHVCRQTGKQSNPPSPALSVQSKVPKSACSNMSCHLVSSRVVSYQYHVTPSSMRMSLRICPAPSNSNPNPRLNLKPKLEPKPRL